MIKGVTFFRRLFCICDLATFKYGVVICYLLLEVVHIFTVLSRIQLVCATIMKPNTDEGSYEQRSLIVCN